MNSKEIIMNIMKFIYLLILLTIGMIFSTNNVLAQDTIPTPKVSSKVVLSATRTSWQKNKVGDNWFVSFGSGAQMLFGQDDSKGSFGGRITYAPAISYGKYLSPIFGMRLNLTGGSLHGFNDGVGGTYNKWSSGKKNQFGEGYAGKGNYPSTTGEDFLTWDPQWTYLGFQSGKDIIFRDGHYIWEPGTRGKAYQQTVHYANINLNAMIQLTSLFAGYDADRKFGLILFGGPSVFHVFPHEGQVNETGIGGNLGFQGTYKLNKYSDFFAEASATAYPDKFDGHMGGRSYDLVSQLMVGITCKLGKQRWDREITDNSIDLEIINENINEMKAPKCVQMSPPQKPVLSFAVNYLMPDPESVKKRNMDGEAYVIFETGKSVLLPGIGQNTAELANICKSIDYVKDEPTASIDKIMVTGYASPEGSEITNNRLSKTRSDALVDYVKVLYKFDDNLFTVKSGGENWDGLVDAIAKSNLTDSEKRDIRDIINNNSNITTRKNKIKAYNGGQVYKYLLTEVYPGLRRTDYRIAYTAAEIPVSKGKQLIFTKPTMLSQYEMFAVARSFTKGSEQFYRAIEVAYALYPEDETANINAAAVALEKNDLTKAASSLLQYQTSSKTYNNLGVLYALQENFDEAERYFKMAQSVGVMEASKNLYQLNVTRKEMQKYNQELQAYNQFLQDTQDESSEEE